MMRSRRVGVGLGVVVVPLTLALLVAACSSEDSAPPAPPSVPPASASGAPAFFVDTDPATGAADLMVANDPLAPSAVNGVTYEQAARAFIDQHKAELKLTDPANQLALESVGLVDGVAHVRFFQREGGYRVDGADVTVHFRADGSIATLDASLAPLASKGVVTALVTERAALATVEADINTKIGGYDPKRLDAPPEQRLVLQPSGANATLVWKIDISGQASRAFSNRYYVDAVSGAILSAIDGIHTIGASGKGYLGDTKSFEALQDNNAAGKYAMYQGGVGGQGGRDRIVTHAWTGEGQPEVVVRSNDLNSWDTAVAEGVGAAVDAHKNMSDVDAWYRSKLGYASFDGRGSPLKVIAHDNRAFSGGGNNRANAYWDRTGGMHFGDGDVGIGGAVRPTSICLDVAGHEFTHGVNQYSNGLEYQNESGALDEALADIFGTFIEHDYVPIASSIWLIGEGSWTGGIRSMADPGAFGDPDHMSKKYTGGDDGGGVHTNSGIINNTWFLMTWGAVNKTSGVPVNRSLGFDDSRRVWWATLRTMLGKNATFEQTARRQTAWAKTRGFPLEAVACAWVATGVLKNDYVKSRYNVTCYCETDDGGVATTPDQLKCCDPGKAADQCCKRCDDAGPGADAGATADGGQPTQVDLYDSCKGRADGVYCSQLAAYSAIVCKNESITSGQQCASNVKCIGPNGPGAAVQCEGQAPPPPPADAGAPGPQGDTCSGRADGIYCSVVSPYSAYVCKGESVAGGQLCATGQLCTGPNGAGTQITCK